MQKEKKRRPAPKVKKKVWKNQTQRAVGNLGESAFYEFYRKEGICYANGKLADFFNINTRKTIELKTDQHEPVNLFLEKFSNVHKGSWGGVYKSVKDGVDFFCYYFINHKKCYWFNSDTLFSYLERNQDSLKLKTVFNKGYDSNGYCLPLELVEDLIIREDSF